MTRSPVASLILDVSDERPISGDEESIAIDIDLPVFDERIRGRIFVADRPAGLGEVVPPARALADEIVRRAARRSGRDGLNVNCTRGCAACCRYLVPLSVPETLRLWDELRRFPARRRERAIAAFVNASRRILAAEPPPPSQPEVRQNRGRRDADLSAIDRWYAEIDADCPLLEGETCTVYPLRPIACREHAAVCPPEYCRPAHPGRGRRLKLPFSIVEALGRLAAEMEGAEIESVILPLAPAWCDANPARGQREWPAPAMFERFAAIVHDLADRRPAAADAA